MSERKNVKEVGLNWEIYDGKMQWLLQNISEYIFFTSKREYTYSFISKILYSKIIFELFIFEYYTIASNEFFTVKFAELSDFIENDTKLSLYNSMHP